MSPSPTSLTVRSLFLGLLKSGTIMTCAPLTPGHPHLTLGTPAFIQTQVAKIPHHCVPVHEIVPSVFLFRCGTLLFFSFTPSRLVISLPSNVPFSLHMASVKPPATSK